MMEADTPERLALIRILHTVEAQRATLNLMPHNADAVILNDHIESLAQQGLREGAAV